MEKCQSIEEVLKDGERKLIIHFGQIRILVNEHSLLYLLLEFGSISSVKEYFNDYKLIDIENYFKKRKIAYEIG